MEKREIKANNKTKSRREIDMKKCSHHYLKMSLWGLVETQVRKVENI